MDGIALVLEAQAAGLSIRLEGDRLVVHGPKSADAVARRLLAHKAVVVAALQETERLPGPEPAPGPFDGWTLRPDVDGRMGLEAPDVPERRRWWARATFDNLPVVSTHPDAHGPAGPKL
jgi:hypothetical protein